MRRTSHSKIKTYDESYCQDAVARIVLDFSKRVKRSYGSQDPWSSIAKEDRSGRPDQGTDLFKASDHHYHDQFVDSFSSASYSNWDDDRAWSSQEWKPEIKTYERSGRFDKIFFFENATKCSTWSRGNSSRRNRTILQERGNIS